MQCRARCCCAPSAMLFARVVPEGVSPAAPFAAPATLTGSASKSFSVVQLLVVVFVHSCMPCHAVLASCCDMVAHIRNPSRTSGFNARLASAGSACLCCGGTCRCNWCRQPCACHTRKSHSTLTIAAVKVLLPWRVLVLPVVVPHGKCCQQHSIMALSLSKRTTLDLLAINFFNVNSQNRSNTTPSGVARPAKNKLAGSAYEKT